MQKKKWPIPLLTAVIIIALWLTGLIPKQIAKIAGTGYVTKHFPEMELTCTGVEYASVFGDYLIGFEAKNGKTYSVVIGPELLPITLGQGLTVIEGEYEEHYQSETFP